MLTVETNSSNGQQLRRRFALMAGRKHSNHIYSHAHPGRHSSKSLTPPTVSATEENIRAHLAAELRNETTAFVSEFTHEVETLRAELARGGVRADCSLERIQALVATLTERMQSIVREETAPPISEIGLERALEGYCQHLCDRKGLELSYESHIQESAVDPGVKLIVFRVAQDTLDHIAEHRHAGFVAVRLIQEDGDLYLRIEDMNEPVCANGSSSEATETAFLQRLEERLTDCDGQLQASSGNGFHVLAFQIPLAAARSARAA